MFLLLGCTNNPEKSDSMNTTNEISLQNEKIKSHDFLPCMYGDDYFPKHLVDKCKDILVELCYKIESQPPKNADELYLLSHASTEKINALQTEFFKNGSEIETAARDCLAMEFMFIAQAYEIEADLEEMIAPREW